MLAESLFRLEGPLADVARRHYLCNVRPVCSVFGAMSVPAYKMSQRGGHTNETAI